MADETENNTGEDQVQEADDTENGGTAGEALEPDSAEATTVAVATAAEEVDEGPTEDCPPCKGGAPAWMATFADMATLLMAFFVLILSFAQMNVPKFKEVSGSMNDSMGVQRQVPVVEPPTADNIIATQFSQAKVQATALQTISEQTTDEEQPVDPELQITTSPSKTPNSSDIEMVKSALRDEIEKGLVSVNESDGTIEVAMVPKTENASEQGESGKQSGRRLDADTVEVFAKVAEAQAQVATPVQVVESSPREQSDSYNARSASLAEQSLIADNQVKELRARLSEDISNGRVNVEKVDNQVKITLADQGSFTSGSADLKTEFFEVLNRVGSALNESGGDMIVAGHTDSVPVAFSERFQSNWDLSVSRSASVVDYLVGQGFLDSDKVTVTGYADTVPVATNDTAAGRAQNRRIEIMVDNDA